MSLSLPLEPSLTATNLCSLLADVKDWSTEGLPFCLRIPDSKVKEMEQLYPDLSQRPSTLTQYFLDGNPAPSWELVCWALYMKEEYEVLENVQNKYFKGTVYTYYTVLWLWKWIVWALQRGKSLHYCVQSIHAMKSAARMILVYFSCAAMISLYFRLTIIIIYGELGIRWFSLCLYIHACTLCIICREINYWNSIPMGAFL